ncbi:MAG: RecX family transcriptional regulator [Paludibacter sp.]|nr:RecX family transcriptional regulator [Paludibacter sp.]
MTNPNYEMLLGKAAAFCSLSEHCISEIKEKLVGWGASDLQIKKIVAHLLKEKYIDQQRFATAYARDKLRFNYWGKIKIGFMLRSKDIDNEIITSALESINADEYQNVLHELIKAKEKTIKAASNYEKRGKLMRFLQGKGFEFAEMERAINAIS